MEKYIQVTPETRRHLVALFRVTPMSVWNALNFRRDNDLARRIRRAAINHGGQVILACPECETIHDADGIMRQQFPTGAVITVDKTTALATLIHPDGHVVTTVPQCTIAQLSVLQQEAQTITSTSAYVGRRTDIRSFRPGRLKKKCE